MKHQINEKSFAQLVEGICVSDRELRLELERKKSWDIYQEILEMAYERYVLGLSIRESFGLSYSSTLSVNQEA